MFKIVGDLKRSDPAGKKRVLERMRERNIAFFQEREPRLAEFLKTSGSGRFEIRIDHRSIDIIDRSTGQVCHPPGQLFEYMADFGSWHHTAWVDRTAIQHLWRGESEHGQLIVGFLRKLYAALPALSQRDTRPEIKLPVLPDGRRYSGPVIFLGIFTGLHIMSYLGRTAVADCSFIEPDADRFALSSFFLDYGLIEKTFGRVLLHVGPDMPPNPVELLIAKAPVTSSVWVRLLPAYPDGRFDEIIGRVDLKWRSFTEVFVPFDREVRNLRYGAMNLDNREKILSQPPQLSRGSTIAVVASGPSLNKDLEWLRANQGWLTIMATISCVRVLMENGIKPDFQCTLDTEIEDALLAKLQLPRDVPLVAYYKINPAICDRFDTVCLVPEALKANLVRFRSQLANTHPTSGNFATAVAAWCRPSRLLFFGLDLGFRDVRESHVKGGWHDENEGVGHGEETGGRGLTPVPSNFPESEGSIFTMAYYNVARQAVEAVVGEFSACGGEVLNCSDGALIAGAKPMRSQDVAVSTDIEKAINIAGVLAGFECAEPRLWDSFAKPPEVLISNLRLAMLRELDIKEGFGWPSFGRALDQAWAIASPELIGPEADLRHEAYGKLISDLLAEWYRSALLTESLEESKLVYETGRTALDSLIEGLELPSLRNDQVPGAHA